MAIVQLEGARSGNSGGVRLPAATLVRDRIGAGVLMEEGSEGILLRPPPAPCRARSAAIERRELTPS